MEQVTYEGEVIQGGGAVQHVNQGSVMSMANLDPERAVEHFEKRITVLSQFKAIALKVTNPTDWVDQNGRPYLQTSGVQKVSSTFGISYAIVGYPVKQASSDDVGDFYTYTAMVEVSHPMLGKITMDGSASSRDQFFAKKKNGDWKKSSEILETNISKKSVTNAVGRGVKALLGMNNLTWEEVQKGYQGGAATSVKYDGKKGQPSNGNGTSSHSTGNPKADLKAALHALCDGDEQAMADKLQELSTFKKDGEDVFKRNVDDLSDKWAARILNDHPELQVPK